MGTKNNFEENFFFEQFASDFGFFLDNHKKGALYGKVSGNGYSVLPIRENTMRPLIPEKTNIYCLNFVSDAFRDLNLKYYNSSLVLFGEDEITPIKSFEDGYSLYGKHIDLYIKRFVEAELIKEGSESDVLTFEQFLHRFKVYASKPQMRVPLLLSSFVRSRFCPPHATGLYIELDKRNYTDLEAKSDTIIDIEVENFQNLAHQFGFVVPKHAPWCLMANINSTRMYQYALEYDVLDRDMLLPSYYIECRFYDIDYLRSAIENNFHEFMERTRFRSTTKVCKNVVYNQIEEINYSREDAKIEYSTKDWIRFYFEMYMIERGEKRINLIVDKVVEECYYIYQRNGFQSMYEYGLSKLKLDKNRWKDKYK